MLSTLQGFWTMCLNLFQLQVLLVNCRSFLILPFITPSHPPRVLMPFKVFIPIMLSFNVGTNSMDNMMDYASDV